MKIRVVKPEAFHSDSKGVYYTESDTVIIDTDDFICFSVDVNSNESRLDQFLKAEIARSE